MLAEKECGYATPQVPGFTPPCAGAQLGSCVFATLPRCAACWIHVSSSNTRYIMGGFCVIAYQDLGQI
jgi:hypothetical protein